MRLPTQHTVNTAAMMARISQAASSADGDLTKTALLKMVPGGGSESEKRWAIQALIADGYLSEWVQRTTHWLTHVRLFTTDDDPSLRKCAREECGREFHASRGWHRFCSPLCRERHRRPVDERSCEHCGQAFTTTRSRQRFCKPACTQAAYQERFMRAPDVVLTAGTQGAISEMAAAVDLLRRGYEVFRALSPNAGCDLIALKGGSTLRIEVRTGKSNTITGRTYFSRNSTRTRRTEAELDHYAIVVGNTVTYEPELPQDA